MSNSSGMQDVNDVEEFTIEELYARLVLDEDFILDMVPVEQLFRLRKGLSNYKTKLNEKAKKAQLPTEERRIEFDTIETNAAKGYIKIRVYFVGDTRITGKLIKSDGDLK